MSEATSVRPVMLPPPGFTEQAVERGLSQVLAEEALDVLAQTRRLQDALQAVATEETLDRIKQTHCERPFPES